MSGIDEQDRYKNRLREEKLFGEEREYGRMEGLRFNAILYHRIPLSVRLDAAVPHEVIIVDEDLIAYYGRMRMNRDVGVVR
jgi:hypothetical protein